MSLQGFARVAKDKSKGKSQDGEEDKAGAAGAAAVRVGAAKQAVQRTQ